MLKVTAMPKHGFLLPDQIEDHDLICVSLKIPDEALYIAAFKGALETLTKWFNWQNDTDKRGALASGYWRDLLLDHLIIGDCDDMALSCSDVELCLQTSDFLNQEINNSVGKAIAIANGGGNAANGGVPGNAATLAQQQANIVAGTNNSCNKDVLWSQCLALVQYVNRLATDMFEKLEVATNIVELADGIGNAVPALAAVWDAAGADGVADLINYFQEAIEEQYAAQYTQSYEEELACEIFCLCRDDCEITAERLFSVMEGRFQAYISEPLDTLFDLIETLAGTELNSNIVVDSIYFLSFGSFYLSNLLLPGFADRALSLLLKLAVNDASNDWELLCDCPDDWLWQSDFAGTQNIWVSENYGFDDLAVYQPGTGFVSTDAHIAGQSYSRIILVKTLDFQENTEIERVRVVYDYTGGSFGSTVVAVAITVTLEDNTSLNTQLNNLQAGNGTAKVIEFFVNKTNVRKISVLARSSNRNQPNYSGAVSLNEIRVTGSGFNPFE